MRIKGYLYILIAAILWGLLGPVSKFAWFIWKELFSDAGFVGAALILSGVILTIVDGKQTKI